MPLCRDTGSVGYSFGVHLVLLSWSLGEEGGSRREFEVGGGGGGG